ncbi:MAG TPA: hypothetical protein VFM10_04545, partial [Terriglobales bacterium]|nr:hypothetical protein [Terriglobales bacterium]
SFFVAAVAVCALLSVLVSPFVPTPISVSHGKRITSVSYAMAAPAYTMIARIQMTISRLEPNSGFAPTRVSVIEWTCARIC